VPAAVCVENVEKDNLEKHLGDLGNIIADHLQIPAHDIEMVGLVQPTDEEDSEKPIFIRFNKPLGANTDGLSEAIEDQLKLKDELAEIQATDVGKANYAILIQKNCLLGKYVKTCGK
jgi:hypothetical protein